MSSDDEKATNKKSLATIILQITQLFHTLSNITTTTTTPSQGIEKDDLIKQQHRFELWALNFGRFHQAEHEYEKPVEDRFRDAPEFRQFCWTLLEDLLETLGECKFSVERACS